MSNVVVEDCSEIGCYIGPAVFENVSVRNLTVADLLILWSPCFRHVVLAGKIGALKINKHAGSVIDPKTSATFDAARRAFYSGVDWALDIRDADPLEMDIEGVPTHLIRRNFETQGIVRRCDVIDDKWRTKVSSNCDYWIPYIDGLVGSDEPDMLLVTPTRKRRAKVKEILAGLRELRELGIADVPAGPYDPVIGSPPTGLEPMLAYPKRKKRSGR